MDSVSCQACGRLNALDARYCNGCATELGQLFCPDCHRANPASAEFCSYCAKPLFYARPEPTMPQPPSQPRPIQQHSDGDWKAFVNRNRGLVIFFAVIGAGFLLALIFRSDKPINRPSAKPPTPSTSLAPSPPKATELNAAVRFDGKQFTITNKDSFDWNSVKMEINGGIFSGGYELKTDVMKAGQTYTVGSMQFADSDGKRFNPFQMKPQKFVIAADTSSGRLVYVGGWD